MDYEIDKTIEATGRFYRWIVDNVSDISPEVAMQCATRMALASALKSMSFADYTTLQIEFRPNEEIGIRNAGSTFNVSQTD